MMQSPPFCVKLELSEGCNLYCDFCGLRSIRHRNEKNFKFMTPETARLICEQMAALGWKSRIELALRGEPTMNPDHAACVAAMRAALPRVSIMMTSNGGGLLVDTQTRVRDLFAAGLNALALDDYDGAHIVGKILTRLDNCISDGWLDLEDAPRIRFYKYPAEKDGNPNARRKFNEHVLTIIQDIERATKGTHSRVHNTAGLSAPRDRSYNGRRCARPFREIAIRWNGDVALCCLDWRGTYKIGNVLTQGLAEIWQHPHFAAARVYLGNGQRGAIPTCDGCTSTSVRPGLLPDPMGKMRMPVPTVDDARLVQAAEAGAALTAPIRRDWEQ